MIEGEFLTADDLGPLGRLVAPGELVVLSPHEAGLVQAERAWIERRYREADQRAEAMRKRLKAARLGAHGAAVRALFEDWTVEAAKLALCARYLLAVTGRLDAGEEAVMDLNKGFHWSRLPKIIDVVHRVLQASDEEISDGLTFRAQ